ncbi:hypothetical protein M378DRAFT_961549 [Amanita muscaria Koide BX008]|uniref:Uncharacterized protein n=1 Tax=Amanita muscaria (strain Koide BX008) TaxID=946122 RepID=A0A0C2T0G5_AMAMK|nr:hypothetical protein M378DRAFT_961549 [Amanita muscaria Koide BX008]
MFRDSVSLIFSSRHAHTTPAEVALKTGCCAGCNTDRRRPSEKSGEGDTIEELSSDEQSGIELIDISTRGWNILRSYPATPSRLVPVDSRCPLQRPGSDSATTSRCIRVRS